VPVPDGFALADVEGRQLAAGAHRNADVVALDPDGVAVLTLP
jgi:hypothetical protein